MQLTHWFNKLQHLIDDFTKISFMHVNMELNMQEDMLSKVAIVQIDRHSYFEL